MSEHILSLSYGKDSLACLGAIEALGWPLDRIIHAEVWATDTIPADLPPMVEFKAKADRIIKERWGIEVEHVRSKWVYEKYFYRQRGRKAKFSGVINGFPMQKRNWCVGRLKTDILDAVKRQGVTYIGIAADEPNRFHNLTETKRYPLVEETGRRPTAECGARKTTCSPRSTPRRREAGAGSAITKVWISCGFSAATIPNTGRCS